VERRLMMRSLMLRSMDKAPIGHKRFGKKR